MKRYFKAALSTMPDAASTMASVPAGLRLYGIGDVHGRLDLLRRIYDRICADARKTALQSRNVIIFLGDYIDRGPESKGVIDFLLELPKHHQHIFLKGNHEATLLRFLDDAQVLAAWRNFGGRELLHSYGVRQSALREDENLEAIRLELTARMPESHLDFYQNLQTSASIGDYHFVHAGIRPGVALHRQCEEDLLWIRADFLDHKENHGKVIVHGHTPVEQPQVLRNRINIDTGAYLTGNLTCLVLEGRSRRFL